MAQLTLLNMVQNILSAMSSDEVNSIGDTVESMQVAQIIQNKYYDIIARGDLTLDNHLFQLNPSINPNIPVMMMLPSTVSRIDWLQYYDTNPSDGLQNSQFGSYSHGLNLDLVSTVNWTTTSTTSVTAPVSGSGSVVFTVGSNTLPASIGQPVQCVSGTCSIIGKVASYVGFVMTIAVTSVTNPGTFSSWVITSVNVPNLPPGYKHVDIVTNEVFIEETKRLDLSQSYVFSYTFAGINTNPQPGAGFTFRGRNDRQPTMCSLFTNIGNVLLNSFILFDSYDATQDSTLQSSKTLAMCQTIPSFALADNSIPALDDIQFPLLLNEAKSTAFYELKQMPHTKADQEIQRQWAVTQARKSKSNKPSYFDQLSDYGRVPRTGGQSGYPLYNRFMRNV